MTKGCLADLAKPGQSIAVRVTPKASRDRLVRKDGLVRAYVTVPAEGGKANAAVKILLSKALGLPKSRLRLVRGQTSRDKLFKIETD